MDIFKRCPNIVGHDGKTAGHDGSRHPRPVRGSQALGMLLLAMLTLGFTDCKGEASGSGSSDTGSVSLSVTPTELSFTADGGSETVEFTASSSPSFVSDGQTWFSYKKNGFSNNQGTATITVEANGTSTARTGKYTVKCGSESATITITQEAGTGSVVTPTDEVDPTEEPAALDNDAWAFSKKLGLGWNLGNHFDTYNNENPNWTTYWDKATPTAALFTKLKSYGFSSVRIPVTWYQHMNSDFTVTDDYMKEVAEVVGWALDAGLFVIINTHHDDADSKNWLSLARAVASSDNLEEITTKFNKLWNQIATYFKDYNGDMLMFESFNEMHDGTWNIPNGKTDAYYEVINYWNQQFVNTVRYTGGNNATRMLGVPGYAANPSLTVGNLVLPTEPDASVTGKIAVAVHDYDPYDYAINSNQNPSDGTVEYQKWGHSATGRVCPQDESDFVATLKMLYDTYLVNNIPVYIGECGCKNKKEAVLKYKLYYLEYTYKAFKSYGLAGFIWDNGSNGEDGTDGTEDDNHAYINHNNGEYLNTTGQKCIAAIKKAVTTESSSYTLKSVYNSAP